MMEGELELRERWVNSSQGEVDILDDYDGYEYVDN